MHKFFCWWFLSLFPFVVCAQEQVSEEKDDPLQISVYADNYWGLNFNNVSAPQRPLFIYNYARNDAFSTNLAILEAKYRTERWKITVALQAGDFSVLYLPDQSPLIRSLYNSTIGLKVAPKVWVEVGLKPSYLAIESLLGYQDLALTRSLLVDNVPYLFPGVMVNVGLKNDWYFKVHANNGWVNNQGSTFNQGKSLGLELQYETDEENSLSFVAYSGFEDQSEQYRETLFGDFHFRFTLTDRWKVLFTSYAGVRYSKTVSDYQSWGGTLAVAQYRLSPKFFLTGRYQYFFDPNRVVIRTDAPGKFIVHGLSANLDYQIFENIKLRAEALRFSSANDAFVENGTQPTTSNFFGTIALQVYFPDFP